MVEGKYQEKAVEEIKEQINDVDETVLKQEEKRSSELVKSVKEEVKNNREHAKTNQEQIDRMLGKNGSGKEILLARGFTLRFLPVSMYKIPELNEKIRKTEFLENSSDELFGQDVLKNYAEIAYMGVEETHPEITVEWLMKNMSLGDFPKILDITMDLNDFFVGMRKVALKHMTSMANLMQTANLIRKGQNIAQTNTQK